MVYNFLNRELAIITRSVARFIDLTVGRAMGCFFACIRVRDDRPRPHNLQISKSTEPAVSRNRISSLFVDEEEKGDLESPQISNGLKDEAKFLKACGTIPETPVEIRKASQKFKQSPPCGEDSETSKFHSWLPDASIDKFQFDQTPTPNKLLESSGRSSNSPENTPASKTPGDRPFIGLVAAHWNEDESSRVSPKWWDGNGIPNSTTKYKEDQKVSWHATPFEERLEKALSDETRISQRKQYVDQPRIYLDEADDNDTALSQLRPSSHSRSVVSV